VQMTWFPEGSINNPSLSEDFPQITGSVPQMIQATLDRFRNLFIRERVIKVPNQMEALRIFNYPYQAIEEAVVNAFYHRDYDFCEPVTIEIEPDCINIMNFPGIDRSISDQTIAEGNRFVSRYYRNRRLGEFLKELELSEGHSTGIPTIQEELERNGSPKAEFYTDEDRRAMRIRIPIHPAFLEPEEGLENTPIALQENTKKTTGKTTPKLPEKPAVKTGSKKSTVKKPAVRIAKKTLKTYDQIAIIMSDGNWHKAAEIEGEIGLKGSRTREILKKMIEIGIIEDNGKFRGRLYRNRQ